MLSPETKKKTSEDNLSDEREMTRYGIEPIPVDCFRYREFRYTNVKDAIVQAKRDEKSHERKCLS